MEIRIKPTLEIAQLDDPLNPVAIGDAFQILIDTADGVVVTHLRSGEKIEKRIKNGIAIVPTSLGKIDEIVIILGISST